MQGSPGPLRLSQVPQYWRSSDKDASSHGTGPSSRIPGLWGGKGPRSPGCPLHAPAYTVISIITWSAFLAIVSFNNLIPVAEKFPPYPPPSTILKIMHRNSKGEQGAEKSALKRPALEPHHTGVNSLFRTPEFLLPGNHPAAGFSYELGRMLEKQQSA